MATDTLPTPSDIASEYLTNLAVLKPGEIDVNSTDNDWFIRAQVTGGVVSGIYNDLSLLENDIFPQSARHDAIGRHLATFFTPPDNTFKPATNAVGNVVVAGLVGTVIPVSTIFVYPINGNQYQPSVQVTLTAATGSIEVISSTTGQSQNLQAGAMLTISNPPSGLQSTATVDVTNISDGTDVESDAAAIQRILLRLQSPPAGGTAADYKNYALAVPGVTNANSIRFIYGLGTVGVAITSGTANIDEAIDNNEPIIRIPSQDLLNAVQLALEAQVPETDCVYTLPVNEIPIDVTAQVSFSTGDQNTVPTGQTLTQGQFVIREISRAIYKTPPGGRVIEGTGYVVAADIEETLDNNLGNTSYSQGQFVQILADRQVLQLSASGYNIGVLPSQIMRPGTITLEVI